MNKANNQIKFCVASPGSRDLLNEKLQIIQSAGGKNKLFDKSSIIEYLLIKGVTSILDCEDEFAEARGDLRDFKIIDQAIEMLKENNNEKDL